MLAAVAAQTSLQNAEVVNPSLVAIPRLATLAWHAHIHDAEGLYRYTIIVDANPSATPAVILFEAMGVAGLLNTAQIDVRSVPPDSPDFKDPGWAFQLLSTDSQMNPLLGSTDDFTTDLQLANPDVVTIDFGGFPSTGDLATQGTRFLSSSGTFNASTGLGLQAQVFFHLVNEWFDYTDTALSSTVAGVQSKRWDTILGSVEFPSQISAVAPGQFKPRASIDLDRSDLGAPARVIFGGANALDPAGQAFPELVHQPAGPGTIQEPIGSIGFAQSDADVQVIAHEFGHFVDLFLGPLTTNYNAPTCGANCTASCVAGTSEEAPALAESIAQIFSLFYLARTFDVADFNYCEIISSLGNANGFDPGPCMPPNGESDFFIRDEVCPPGVNCDRPSTPGFNVAMDGVTLVPTGACSADDGYRTLSLFQVFWSLIHGFSCDPNSPFSCQTVTWGTNDPAEPLFDALLYALELNPASYDEFLEDVLTHVACNAGAAAYGEVNALLCAHEARDCAAPMPVACGMCGNGVREGGETCDGNDWVAPDCASIPGFIGGTLSCDATCQLDVSACIPDVASTSSGSSVDSSTSAGGDSSSGIGASSDTDPTAGGTGAGDGCGCSAQRGPTPLHMLLLLVGAMLVRRRRGS